MEVLALISGLNDVDFTSYLGRKILKTLTTLLVKANEFIKSNEFDRSTNIRRDDSEITKKEK